MVIFPKAFLKCLLLFPYLCTSHFYLKCHFNELRHYGLWIFYFRVNFWRLLLECLSNRLTVSSLLKIIDGFMKNIHGIFPFHKRFYKLEVSLVDSNIIYSKKAVLWGTKNGSSVGNHSKPGIFFVFYFYSQPKNPPQTLIFHCSLS